MFQNVFNFELEKILFLMFFQANHNLIENSLFKQTQSFAHMIISSI